MRSVFACIPAPAASLDMPNIKVPSAWEAVDLSAMRGTLLILGAPDAGKTTLTRYLYGRLVEAGGKVSVLDGDPGQSTIGPPTTMTLAMGKDVSDAFQPDGRRWQQFVGATSPVGHMLRVVVGAGRLVGTAERAGAEVILYDTTGLVDPRRGGLYLKLAKIDLLQPTTVIALHGDGELEPLLEGLRRSRRLRLIELPTPEHAQERGRAARQAHRARRFKRYFEGAGTLTVHWQSLAVLPKPRFDRDRLVSLEDDKGFVRALGIVEAVDLDAYEVTLRTSLRSLDSVDAVRIGDVGLYPDTFRDRPMRQP